MNHHTGNETRCAVIGYGSWATAIAGMLAARNSQVGWYVRNPEVLEGLRNEGRNPRYLSDMEFDRTRIAPSDDLNAVVRGADLLVLATPSAYLKDFLAPLTEPLDGKFVVSAIKGIVPGDYRFPALFVQRWNERRPDAPLRSYWEVCSRQPEGQKDYEIFDDPDQRAPSHQVGGWPFFTQNDPRTPEEHPDFEILLFQLDSEMRDRKDLVLWGDCGVGGFFIRPEDLRARDFSRVMYNWDCG